MKIGLIALAGLRICDTDLIAAGFTFPALRRRMKQIESLPSLGLLTLAGLPTPPYEVEYEYLEILPDAPTPSFVRFDALAFSCLAATSAEAYRHSAAAREIGIPTILGGLHATLSPDEAAPHFNSLAIGEGETVWPAIIGDLHSNTLQSCYDARPFAPFDMQLAPEPRYDLLPTENDYRRITVQTARGCPLSCSFCAASIRLRPGYRTKSSELVTRDIRALSARFPRPFLELADDNSFANKRHGLALAEALGVAGFPWFAETDISVADHPNLLRAIASAGCRQLLIGLEAPSRKPLEGIEHLTNWKAKRAPRYAEAIHQIQSHGIAVNGCFVLGLDGQDPSCFHDVLTFAQETGLADVQVTYLTPFPGTPLHAQLSEQGRLLSTAAPDRCTLFDINFQPDSMSVHELREGFHSLVANLYNPDAVKRRLRSFRQQKRHAPT